MKLQKDSSINVNNKPLMSNNVVNLYPQKLNNLKEMKSINSAVEAKRKIAAKTAFDAEKPNKHLDRFDKIKSSIFQKNDVKLSKDKTNNNNSQNLTKSLDEKGDYFTNKNERPVEGKDITKVNNNNHLTNFSSNFSSRTNFPGLKSTEKNSILGSCTNSKMALAFFKLPNRKSAISLKKDANCEKINVINYLSNNEKVNDKLNYNVPLKYPKKPRTMDYNNCLIGSRSNVNTANNNQKINQTNIANKIRIKSHSNKTEQDVFYNNHNNKVNNNYCVVNSENNSSYYKTKGNENLNIFSIDKTNQENEARITAKPNTSSGFSSSVLNKHKSNFAINKNLVNKLNTASKENSISPVKENKYASENCNYETPSNKNHLYHSPSRFQLYAKNTDNLSSRISQDLKLNENRTNGTDVENANINRTSNNFNSIELIPINNKSLNYLNLSKNNNSNPQLILNNFKGNNITKENSAYFSPSKASLIQRSFSPNKAENYIGNLKKFGSLQNFINSENLLYKENNLEKSESRFSKLASQANPKMVLLRFRTADEIECQINPKINQDTYKSVQDVLDMPTSYLPFSKKRDKLTELEKQSFYLQNKVEKELKEAKKLQSRKIKIKSKNELSNYLMRDYFIGEKGDTIASSKKRMRITKDFERDKEIQKKKKMALLKNEEYKETDKEDLSDSDVNVLFETVDEEEKPKEIDKEKINSSNLSTNKINKDLENSIKEGENINDNLIEDINNNDIVIINDANKNNTDKDTKKSKYENDDYFIEEDSNTDEHNLTEESKKIFDSQADLENSIQSKASVKENIKRQSFALNANEVNMEKKIIMLSNNNNTRNIKSIEENKSSNFRSTIGSFNNKINLDNKRVSFNFRSLKDVKNYESNEMKTINQVEEEDKMYLKQESSVINPTNKLSSIKNLPLDKLQDFIKTKKKKLKDKMFDEIKLRSEAKADQILDISLGDYSEIEPEDSDRITNNNVNMANLNRVIRVRNILKGRHKDDNQKRQYLGLHKETDDEILKIMRFRRLGPPSFLRTNFKKETEVKFKMLGGKFFGCKV